MVIATTDAFTPPLYSCEAVISEAHFLLSSVPSGRERLIALVNSGRIDLSFSYAARSQRVGSLMHQYQNLPMSFADACLVCMTEDQPSRVFTIDSDLNIYRIHRNQRLDVIAL